MRKLSMILLLILVLPAVLFAGGQGEGAATGTTGVQVNPAGELPIVNEKITLSIFYTSRPLVDTVEENAYTQWLEEETNIALDFEIANQQEGRQKLNILLAGGDYPGIIMDGDMEKAQIFLYGQQGVFLPQNDLIEEYGVETMKVFEEFPLVETNMTFPDGNIYALPDVNDCYHCSMSAKLWIYMPWLDTLGLEVPTTTEEYREVLRAFRDQDPNGNGVSDEIPLAGANQGWHAFLDEFLMQPFVFNDRSNHHLYVDNGEVVASFNQEGWREGLEYMASLYEEGLIAPESFIQDQSQYQQMGENPDAASLGSAVGGHPGVFAFFDGESGRWDEYRVVPPLEGPSGRRESWYAPVYGSFSWVITDVVENVEAAFRLGDFFYTREALVRNNYGRQGVEWRWAEDGEIGINGKQAIWVPLVGRGIIAGDAWWNQAGPQVRNRDWRLGRVPSAPEGETSLEVMLFEETQKYEPYQAPMEKIVPPVSFNEAEAAQLVEIQTAMNDYVREMIARFITGDAALDDQGWQRYLDELDRIGLERYLEIYQAAFDRSPF